MRRWLETARAPLVGSEGRQSGLAIAQQLQLLLRGAFLVEQTLQFGAPQAKVDVCNSITPPISAAVTFVQNSIEVFLQDFEQHFQGGCLRRVVEGYGILRQTQ